MFVRLLKVSKGYILFITFLLVGRDHYVHKQEMILEGEVDQFIALLMYMEEIKINCWIPNCFEEELLSCTNIRIVVSNAKLKIMKNRYFCVFKHRIDCDGVAMVTVNIYFLHVLHFLS